MLYIDLGGFMENSFRDTLDVVLPEKRGLDQSNGSTIPGILLGHG
jgi:hypothetical protein